MNKPMKKQKGITLIALVVTIIVLLILAGISIMMLTGQSGILNQAKSAKEDTRGGEVKEEVALAVSENTMADYTGNGTRKSRQEVIDQLHKEGKLTDDEVKYLEKNDQITIGSIEVDFSALGKAGVLTLVDMYNKAIADNCINENGDCDNTEHLHIGDYVNYPNPTSGTYTVPVDALGVDEYEDYGNNDKTQTYDVSENQLNWRVLGKDSKTGGIKLIADGIMGSNNEEYLGLYMYGAKAYVNGVTELNNICNLYTTKLGTGRSITQKDIDEIAGLTTDELKKSLNYSGEQYGAEYSFQTGHYTPESWLNGKKETPVIGTVTLYRYAMYPKEDKLLGNLVDLKKNIKIASNTKFQLAYWGPSDIEIENTRAYEMMFGYFKNMSFWVGSSYINAWEDFADFGLTYVEIWPPAEAAVCPAKMFYSEGTQNRRCIYS